MPGVDLHHYFVAMRDFVVNWWPLLGLTFYVLLLYIFMRMLALMPKVKAAEVDTKSRSATTWADVAGVDEVRAELQEIVDFLRNPRQFEKLGARVPKGILLHGPPGTGKTMLAKAAAHESGATFFAASASSFIEMFAGLGAARIRRLFNDARKKAPAIIFIDELDAIGTARSGHSLNREQDQTLNQLLVELDGFGGEDQVVVMAASNRLEQLDAALLRPGRFDRQVLVGEPDLTSREAILRVPTRDKPLPPDVDLPTLPRQTAGLTGADLANLANEAAIFAGREERSYITQDNFDEAMERVVAGLQTRRVVTEKEKRVLAFHEAGHALMSYLMGDIMPLHKVSIVGRGNALGYAYYLPTEDRYVRTKEELIDSMKITLAGRAAEHVVFGRISTGAADDLEKVTELARAMVFEYGMSDSAPSRTMRADNYALSEETKRLRDQEQSLLTDGAFNEAVRLLTKHRVYLDRVATTLLQKETLDREEMFELLEGVAPESSASETVG